MKIRTFLPAVLASRHHGSLRSPRQPPIKPSPSAAPRKSPLNTHSGYIHLNPGSDSQIHVIGHVHANNGWTMSSSSDIDARIQKIAANPPITQSGTQVTIGDRDNNDLYRDIAVDLRHHPPPHLRHRRLIRLRRRLTSRASAPLSKRTTGPL